jgi:uncharacterized protein (DUF2147 family)
MKRIACLMVLTALSSPASARGSYSFVIHGHHVHIEASRHCRSLSCVSISVPGVGNWRNGRRDSDDVATVNDPAPAPAPALQPAQPAPAIAPPPTQQPVYAPPVAQVTPAPAPAAPPVTRAQTIPPAAQVRPAPVAPAPARPAPVPAPRLAAAPPAPPPSVGFEMPRPQPSAAPPAQAADASEQARPPEKPVVEQPAPRVAQPVARVAQRSESDDADTPIGDWQTEGKNGLVRIETCGPALCGYMLNASTKAKGETILVNMMPKSGSLKSATQWIGNVYSRSSGSSYYGTITLKEANTLRVEACALGSFFCSGNNWTRLEDSRSVRPEVANSRQNPREPHS